MYKHYKEAILSITYRRYVVECLLKPLALQRSVRVVGLSGMGKSNLLRFLVSHPELLENHPAIPTNRVCFVYLDCNKLNPINIANFYRECYFSLASTPQISLQTDEHLLYKQLELSLLNLNRETLVLLVIDRVEYLYEKIGAEFFSQLRNLRDEARSGQMSFIFGSQRPIGDLYELEKLFTDICWVGPLSQVDCQDFFIRHEARLKLTVEEDDQERLWQLTGGHPGLLKNALDLLKREQIKNIAADESEFIQKLLGYAPIKNYCRRLWENLTPDEQLFLKNFVENQPVEYEPTSLRNYGLLIGQQDHLQLFSPLWQAYLSQEIWPHQEIDPMQVKIEPATRQVVLQWQGRTVKTIINRKLVFDLLEILSTEPSHIYSKDELINALYHDEKAPEVLDDALFQLVTALRKALNPLVKELCPNMTASCIQNVRGVGYRLIVDLPRGFGQS